MSNRLSGTLFIAMDGEILEAAGEGTYSLGGEVRETLTGHDRVHGYKALPQAPFLQWDIRDRGDLDVARIRAADAVELTLQLANGKTVVFSSAWAEGEWEQRTENATISARFAAKSAKELTAA